MIRPATLLALFLLPGLPLMAGSLRVLPWDDAVASRELSITYGKGAVEIDYMHPSARSEPFKIPKEAEDLRLEARDRTDAEGKPVSVAFRIPEGIKSPLLLLIPDKKATVGLRVMVLEDDLGSFRWGTVRMINVTPRELIFRWEKSAKALAPGWKPVEISPGGKSRNMEVGVYLREDLKKPLYSAVWEHRQDMRQLVFAVPNADKSLGPIQFKFVPETRLPEEGE